MVNKVFRADTGHKGDCLREGIFKTLILSRFCRVFDHFTITWAPGGAKIISPLANCFKGSKEEIE